MPFADLREFITAADQIGELRTVRGADWDLEIGTITELNYERQGPALLFDEIKDYPRGYRILANAMDSLRRSLLALGLPVDLSMDDALQEYQRLMSAYKPVPPREVSTGPVYENVLTGRDIDLWKFPTPKWHEDDGGRYLGTGDMVIMRDPDGRRVHFGTYRVMVHDENTAGLYISPIPKYELAGYVRGAPVELVCEEVTGLPIPASAKIAIAGEVPPPSVEARPEGPFGEWTGYYASATRPEPVIRVERLYHRNDPIILGQPPVKFAGSHPHFTLPTQAKNDRERVVKAGVEDVLDVWDLAIPGVTVVQIRQRYAGHAMKAALAASGEYMQRFVVVVDEDIDPRDPNAVLWAIGTRCDPETSLTILKGCQSSWLDPRIPPDRKRAGDLTSSRAIINACKPFEWIKEFPKTNVASDAQRRQVLEKWTDLFPV